MKKKYTDQNLHEACEMLHAAAEAMYESAKALSSIAHREGGIFFPYELLEEAGIAPWDPVEITVSENRLVLDRTVA